MNDIVRQVERARRRLNTELFLRVLPWSMFGALLIACLALAVPKIWVIPTTTTASGWQTWMLSWLGGAAVAGVVFAVVWTWCVRRAAFEAAVEVDRRFGLKERIASTLALTDEERATDMGKALVADASRRVAGLEIGERFRVAVRWPAVLPMVPLAVAFALTLLANATPGPSRSASAATSAAKDKDQIVKSADELKKKLEEERKKAEEKGLADADDLFKKLQEGLDNLKSQDKLDRKEALVKMNDLATELEKRRNELATSEQIKKQLDQLKTFEQGPADKFGKAMQEGNVKKALDELKQIQKQLENGQMNSEQKEQLSKQLEEMQKKLNDMVNAHEQAKQDLEEQIRKKQDAGDQAGAAKLQEKLDQLKQQEKQMSKLKDMASKLGSASKEMKEGNAKEAGQQLSELSDQLQEMQSQLDQLETVDELMNQVADAKSAMNCKECDGEGCEHCQGGKGKDGKGGKGKGKGDQPGNGLGEGRGRGDRPEEKTGTGFYDSKVRGKPKAGEAVRTGYADGPNIPGKSNVTIQEEIAESLKSDPDPITDQRLTRQQRDQARQFFESTSPKK